MIMLCDKEIKVTYAEGSIDEPVSWELLEIAKLPDAISCSVKEERNGLYELSMTYPAQGSGAWRIQSDYILKVTCPLRASIGENLFRIYRVQRDLAGYIYVNARHISGDLSYIPAANTATNWRPYSVADLEEFFFQLRVHAMEPIPYLLLGDASLKYGTSAALQFHSPVSVKAFLGGQELTDPDRTALQLFGGEFVFDNYRIYLYEQRGEDRDLIINYGHNMTALDVDDDLDSVYTSFALYWTGEATYQEQTYTNVIGQPAETTFASLFNYPRTKLVDWTAYVPEDLPATGWVAVQNYLTQAAVTYAQQHNDEGNPVRKIDVDVQAAGISEIYLCDTVLVKYDRNGLSFTTRMKVVSYEWDVLLQRYTKITLGQIKQSLAKIIAEQSTGGQSLTQVKSKVAGVVNDLSTVAASVATISETVSKMTVELGLVDNLNLTNRDAGTVYHFTYGTNAANSPNATAAGHGYLYLNPAGTGYGRMISISDLDIYVRSIRGNVWGAWEAII